MVRFQQGNPLEDGFAPGPAGYDAIFCRNLLIYFDNQGQEHVTRTLGNLLSERIAGLAGVLPHQVHPEDRCGYWFYFFRLQPGKLRCDRAEFVKALLAEGVEASAGYITVPLHRNPVFQKHAFFGGRWPVREFGLTTMDYAKHQTPEAEAILQSGVRIVIHEGMSDEYILSVAEAVRKVAVFYAA